MNNLLRHNIQARTMLMHIENIRTQAFIGIYDWEHKKTQPLLVSIRLEYNPENAFTSDAIKDTMSYEKLIEKIVAKVEGARFNLLENMTRYVLSLVMDHPMVQWAEVTVAKPEIMAHLCDNVSLTLRGEKVC